MSLLKGIPFLRQELTKIFMKRAADKSGIMKIPFKNKNLQLQIEDRLQKYILDAQKQGVDLDMVSNENLKYTIKLNENVNPLSRAISADSPEGRRITEKLLGKKSEVVDMTGKKIDTSQGIMGGKSVKELMESGQVSKGTEGIKKSKKVEDREMFQGANKRLKTDVNKIIADIKAMKPMDSMKEANSVIGRKGVYKNLTPEESKKILKDTEDHIFERDIPIDPEDMAQGGRAGFKGGGLTPEDYLKVKDMLNHWHDYKKSGGKLSKTNFGIAFFRENNAEGGRAGFAGGLLAQLGKRFTSPSGTSGAIELVKGFMKVTGRKPNKDEILKIIREAAERDLDNAISSAKPPGLMSKDEFAMNVGGGSKAIGRRIKEIDQDALRKSIDEFNIPIRTQEPFDFADGGVAGLLGERQNFAMGKRAFLKILGSVGAGIAGLKSGILGLGGKGATKKALTETVKSAGSGTPPPYFFKLVEKIKTLGDDVTEKAAVADRQKVHKYKDYELTEDISTGKIEIKKDGSNTDYHKYTDGEFGPSNTSEEVYMSHTPGETIIGKGNKPIKVADDYIEDTSYVRNSGADAGDIHSVEDGVPQSVLDEVEAGSGNVPESFYTGPNPIKKADGGRIGFDSGGSPLQRLRQSLVDDLMYKFPNMKEQDMQMIVKDINLDMSPEEAQASMSGNFTKVFGSSGMFSTGGRVPLAGGKLADPGYFMFQDLDEDRPFRYEYDASNPEHIKIIRDRLKKKTQELIKQGIIERKLFSEADRMPASNPYFLEFMRDKNLGTGAGKATPEELEKQKRMFSLKQEVKDGGRIGFDGGGLAGMLGE